MHALRFPAGGQRVLDDGREAVLAVAGLDVAGLVEDVDRRPARHGRRAGAENDDQGVGSTFAAAQSTQAASGDCLRSTGGARSGGAALSE
jgi:hypothetical protein